MSSIFDRLPPAEMRGAVFNVEDKEKFDTAIALLKDSLFDKGATFFCSDNIITWNRNYSFLREPEFQEILGSSSTTSVEKSIIWRTYVVNFFASSCLALEGDYLECGCFTGHTAAHVSKLLRYSNHRYLLFDRFEWNTENGNTYFKELTDTGLYSSVASRFKSEPHVSVAKGSLPEALDAFVIDQIAFCHIDLNHPESEYSTFAKIYPLLQKFAVVIFDDYGWWGYSGIKNSIDTFLEPYGKKVLELPTGQGIYIHT